MVVRWRRGWGYLSRRRAKINKRWLDNMTMSECDLKEEDAKDMIIWRRIAHTRRHAGKEDAIMSIIL